MSAPATRGQAITANCRQCIHDPDAAGTWREQVAACPSTGCPLWRFRPVQDRASCPAWIASREPADLPHGWARLEQCEAIRSMRQWIADNSKGRAVRAGRGASGTVARVDTATAPHDAQTGAGGRA